MPGLLQPRSGCRWSKLTRKHGGSIINTQTKFTAEQIAIALKSENLAAPEGCRYIAEDGSGKRCIVSEVLHQNGATDELLQGDGTIGGRNNDTFFERKDLRTFAESKGLDFELLNRAQNIFDGIGPNQLGQLAKLVEDHGVHLTSKSFIQEVARLVEETPAEKLSNGAYLKPNGCMCAATLVVYSKSEKAKKAIDGITLLREAGVVDEDQLNIITSQVDDVVHDEFRALTGSLLNGFELHNAIIRTFDANFSVTKDPKAAANALRALAEANEV